MDIPEPHDGSQIKMTRHVVAYLDILGYRRIIEEAFKDGRGDDELRKLRNAWDKSYTARFRREATSSRPAARFFTDNVVIADSLHWQTDLSGLQIFLMDVAALQWELIENGYFLRGAVEIGDLYMDNEVVFGPALLNAYDAEAKTAKWPRVVLAKRASQCAQEALDAGLHLPLVGDADGRLSVDYLEDRVFIAGGDDRPFDEIVVKHKEIVQQQLERFRNEPDIWMKYYWVGQYHNAFCDKFEIHLADDSRIGAEALSHAPTIHAEAPSFQRTDD